MRGRCNGDGHDHRADLSLPGDAAAAVEGFAAAASGRPDIDVSVLTLFTQPSVPDVREHLRGQDVIVVEGGVVNLMAVWRAHGLREIMHACWEAGVVLTGGSAGSLCWHIGGPTDDPADQPRRETYRRMVAEGALPAGYATEDGVGLHYVDTAVPEAITIRPGKRAWLVHSDGNGSYLEEPLTAWPV